MLNAFSREDFNAKSRNNDKQGNEDVLSKILINKIQ